MAMFIDDDEMFQRKMRFKHLMKYLKSDIEHHISIRFVKYIYREKPYNPIKKDDLPLDKFLKSAYNKRKIENKKKKNGKETEN